MTDHLTHSAFVAAVKFTDDGLVPVIAQSKETGEVLMFAWMTKGTLEETLATGHVIYWSRSRQKVWRKGETSGHTQKVVRWAIDCDADTLLFEVEQIGGACHTGYESCFFQAYTPDGTPLEIKEEKLFDPEKTYASK